MRVGVACVFCLVVSCLDLAGSANAMRCILIFHRTRAGVRDLRQDTLPPVGWRLQQRYLQPGVTHTRSLATAHDQARSQAPALLRMIATTGIHWPSTLPARMG